MRSKIAKNMTTDELKEEYVNCALGAMVYGAKTEHRRRELSQEIERRESENIHSNPEDDGSQKGGGA